MTYSIKARTPEDAIREINRDLDMRIHHLEARLKNTKQATESAKIAYAIAEFRLAKITWNEMTVDRRP